VELISPNGDANIVMNPGDRYTINGNEIAFVVSLDINTAQRIQRYLHSKFTVVSDEQEATPLNPVSTIAIYVTIFSVA
jgi:hypothetical protein